MNIETITTEALNHLEATEPSERPIPGTYRSFSTLATSLALSCLVSQAALAEQGNGNEPLAIPIDITKMFIEYNATDLDVGVQVFLDGIKGSHGFYVSLTSH